MNSKDIAEIMTKYSQTPKNHMQVLEERELAVIFDYLTQHNQVENIESIFADVYHEPKPAQAKPAQPQQSAAKPAAKGESRPQSAAPQADKSGGAAPRPGRQAGAGPGPPRHPRAGEEGGGHPQGRSRQPGEVRRAAGVLH